MTTYFIILPVIKTLLSMIVILSTKLRIPNYPLNSRKNYFWLNFIGKGHP